VLLGCIGDDFTGSSDLANTLVKGGMTVTQYCGIPRGDARPDVEAGVVALKTRSLPAATAVEQSLAALEWLEQQGCRQFLFKYCSTFDSTPAGNIGPVADALADRLGASKVIVCPVFPATGRTLYQGHLFVEDRLLNESGMANHPLTPMTDSDIRRWLARQTKGTVGHVAYRDVVKGPASIGEALTREEAAGHRLIVVDALHHADLIAIGVAAADLPLVTGGSGIATGLPENFRSRGLIAKGRDVWRGVKAPAVVLSGSCSKATREQVERYRTDHPSIEITADAVMRSGADADRVLDWVKGHGDAAPLIYSSADPGTVSAAQTRYGADALARAIEDLFASLASRLAAAGFGRIVSAGGETSGAVVRGLGLEELQIGPEIDPGVPAMCATGRNLAVALKSGNFGEPDFFAKAVDVLGANA
jgi:uncharacterized protein YgbK (DUF1537 family)